MLIKFSLVLLFLWECNCLNVIVTDGQYDVPIKALVNNSVQYVFEFSGIFVSIHNLTFFS